MNVIEFVHSDSSNSLNISLLTQNRSTHTHKMTAEANKEALLQARKQLSQLIETEIELGIMVHDYQATVEAKEALTSRMYVLISVAFYY